MGACASSQKGKGVSDTKLDFSKFGAKADRAIVLPEPPLKDSKLAAVDFCVKSYDDFGSKDETFFDSKAWMDSDCEDDFFSVNGDFTPSRGSTPVHHKFSTGTPQARNSASMAEEPSGAQPSPTGKMRLSELFRESVRENHGVDEQPQAAGGRNIQSGNGAFAKQTILDMLPISPQSGTPHISGANSAPGSGRTSTNLGRRWRDTWMTKSGQCCIPRLISSRSLTERKRRMMMSPPLTVNGKS